MQQILNTSGTRINGWDFLNSLSFTTKEQHVNLLRKMIEEINLDYRNKQQDEIDTKYKLDKIGGFSMEELAKWFDTQKGQPAEDIYNALGMIKGRLDYMDSEWEHKKMARIFFKYAKTYGGDFSKEVIDQTFSTISPCTFDISFKFLYCRGTVNLKLLSSDTNKNFICKNYVQEQKNMIYYQSKLK